MGQTSFRTVVPEKPVVEGQPFTVQYILQDADRFSNFKLPTFMGLRVVNGPDIYTGRIRGQHGNIAVQNFVFTLESIGKGRYIIPGATGVLDGKPLRSNNAIVEVISAREAAFRSQQKLKPVNTEYFLAPGEDPYEKIRRNLFVKVTVDRTECYVGEPVVATYKLYSRLESRSDIIKNPGFYGFAVFDMINLQDNVTGTEIINGRAFDVHTVRQVQLFPIREGTFTVDGMEIRNRVEFSRNRVTRNSEEQVVEGMLGQDETAGNGDTYESNISSTAVEIKVKPIPVKERPAEENGAVGHFSIQASLIKNAFPQNEQGYLDISIQGSGNLIQVNSPQLRWPAGFEAFEPSVIDSLDKSRSPLSGKRTFRFPFTCASTGNFTLPAVAFSFFDPDSGKYKKVVTQPLSVLVTAKLRSTGVNHVSTGGGGRFTAWWPLVIVVIVVATIVVLFARRRPKPAAPVIPGYTTGKTVDELLIEEEFLSIPTAAAFYLALRNAMWEFFASRFSLTGSGHNKDLLLHRLKERNIEPSIVRQVVEIMQVCEEGIFTSAVLEHDQHELLINTKLILQRIDRHLHSVYL
jgi:hypothetical protein